MKKNWYLLLNAKIDDEITAITSFDYVKIKRASQVLVYVLAVGGTILATMLFGTERNKLELAIPILFFFFVAYITWRMHVLWVLNDPLLTQDIAENTNTEGEASE